MLSTMATAGETTLYYTDVTSAPANGFMCVAGRDFPAMGSANLKLDGANGNCRICSSGCDGVFTTYDNSWNRGTASSRLCFRMPASAGDCSDTMSTVILNDGAADSNSLPIQRHSGTVYWVAGSTGNDSNDCLSDGAGHACKTLQGAYNKANDGAQIVVRSGTYSSGGNILTMNDSGTSSQPIQVRAYPGETPVLEYTGSAASGDGIEIAAGYQQIAGFQITSTSSSEIGKAVSVSSGSSNNYRVADTQLGPWETGPVTSGGCTAPSGGSSNGVFVGNRFYRCGTDALTHGIYLANADNITISFNDFDSSGGNGIQLYSPGDSITGIVVENNIFQGNSTGGAGAAMGCNSGCAGVIVRNNLFINNDNVGFRCDADGHNAQVYNNTFHENGSDEIKLVGACDNVSIVNNILFDLGGLLINKDTSGSITVNSNLYRSQAVYGGDPNAVTGDPRFADAANGDYHLLAVSPAIDRGTTPPNARTIDFERNPAPANGVNDLGALEFLSTPGGAESPPQVTGLRRTDDR
jgi:hypothetical protein